MILAAVWDFITFDIDKNDEMYEDIFQTYLNTKSNNQISNKAET